MEKSEIILGLFFSDEDSLIFEEIKFSKEISQESKEQLKMLSYKFLGPIFLTAASSENERWKIDFIESSLSLHQAKLSDQTDVIQSFFNINSSVESDDGVTNLFVIIGSPYTEDVKVVQDKMFNYIHPSILQKRQFKEAVEGSKKNFPKLFQDELKRGFNLIECSLGSSRKLYWKEQEKYYCVGLIERINSKEAKESYLYTLDKDDSLRKAYRSSIPSYYVMAILPNYYENLVDETLRLFEKKGVFSNIKMINLSHLNKKVIYHEESLLENEIKRSYGVILCVESEEFSSFHSEPKSLSHYKKNLRSLLDQNKDLEDILAIINPLFKMERWNAHSEEGLNNIRGHLDSNG